jgi:hypothetical protein
MGLDFSARTPSPFKEEGWGEGRTKKGYRFYANPSPDLSAYSGPRPRDAPAANTRRSHLMAGAA